MAKKTPIEIDAQDQMQRLVRAGFPETALAKINARAIDLAKKGRPRRPNEPLQKWAQALVPFRIKAKNALLEGAIRKGEARQVKSEVDRRAEFDRPGEGGIPPVLGQPTGVPGQAVGIPPAPGAEPLPAALPGAAALRGPVLEPVPPPPIAPISDALATPTPTPIPLGQDPNLITPEQNGPTLPAFTPENLGPAPASGAPTDPVTGLPPLPGLADLPPPVAVDGLPPLPPLPAESLDPAPVATPQSMDLSRRMVPAATQEESQLIAEALDFVSSGDPSFFDLDEGPLEEIQEGPLRPPVG